MARSERKTTKENKSKKADLSQRDSTADKTKHIRDLQEQRKRDHRILDEIWGITLLAFGIFLVVTTQTDTTGSFGEAIHNVIFGLFGIMAYVLPYYFIGMALCLFFKKVQHINGRTTFFSALIFLMLCMLNSYRFLDPNNIKLSLSDIAYFYTSGVNLNYGGVFGMWFGGLIVKLIGKPGLIIFSLSMIAISILLVADTPISKYVAGIREKREEKAILREMMEEEQIRNTGISDEASSLDLLRAEFDAAENIDTSKSGMQILNPVKSGSNLVNVKNRGTMPLDDAPSLSNKNDAYSSDFGIRSPNSEERFLDSIRDADFNREDSFGGEDVTSSEDHFRSSPSQPEGSVSYGLEGFSTQPMGGYGLDGEWEFVSVTPEDNITGMDPTETFSPIKEDNDDLTPSDGLTNQGDSVGEGSSKDITVLSAPDAAKDLKKNNIPSPADDAEMCRQMEMNKEAASTKSYAYPPMSLLKKPKNTQLRMSDHQLEERATLLETTLQNFHVDARVVNVTQGSSVTRYEIQPALGVKVSSITKLADDIALNMRAKSIRIEAPIPGKAAVGIEVENEKPAMVCIRELIDSKEFAQASSKISFVVGKDISGKNVVADLKDMPHLLIAGATGSGKSVCINAIITSLLYKSSPDEVRLILIDPKVVELGNYNGIPHLLIPVVTDPKKAASALNWAVNEMTQRYKLFAEESVKDLDSYNELMRANQEPEKVMPKVVIIIDELADLMMAAPSQVEDSICRLAQLARAAGMHLIVATQRPSVDIVTGLIKANIPSRIAFSVSSQFDSRTILDVGGAEKLLGKGDMLYSPVGENKPLRIQGPYISDSEIAKVIHFVKNQGESDYDQEVIQRIEAPEGSGVNANSDELTEDAIAFILKQQKASVSMLQRRFRIGYNRAANIVDEIEARGIISPADGSKPRQVLYTEAEYYNAIDSDTDNSEKETNE